MNEHDVINKEKEESNFKISANKLQNIKNIYILKKIFDRFNKKKILEIIKYHKYTQQRLNLSKDDFKEYSEKYSSIEIVIIACKSKKSEYIKIEKDKEQYYHIYFNDSKEEIKRRNLNKMEKENNTKIKIKIDYQIESFSGLFFGCECIQSIYFKQFQRNNINSMSYMFYNCLSLKEINFSKFNTINVTSMHNMFSGCSSLKKLNLSNFNTINVTTMGDMFSGCSSLKELDLSNFNTNNVTDMNHMFSKCSSLEKINLSNFNTINVTDISSMFYQCSSLKELDLSSFIINNKIDLSYMFCQCSSLEELNFPGFNPNNVNYLNKIKYMFHDCSSRFINKIKSIYKNIDVIAFK